MFAQHLPLTWKVWFYSKICFSTSLNYIGAADLSSRWITKNLNKSPPFVEKFFMCKDTSTCVTLRYQICCITCNINSYKYIFLLSLTFCYIIKYMYFLTRFSTKILDFRLGYSWWVDRRAASNKRLPVNTISFDKPISLKLKI